MRLKLNTKIMLLSFAAFTAFIMPVSIFADQLPNDVKQMIVSMKGNLTYYVKPGDKVKQGDPLFLVITPDNNPSMFFQIVHKIDHYNKLYLRRANLMKTHAVSQEEFDNALNDLILAKDELASYICKLKQGFYVAPFDCEIVELLFVNGSGIKDGFAAINIKPVDKNYKFEPKGANNKLSEIIDSSNKLLKTQVDKLDLNNVVEILKRVQ